MMAAYRVTVPPETKGRPDVFIPKNPVTGIGEGRNAVMVEST